VHIDVSHVHIDERRAPIEQAHLRIDETSPRREQTSPGQEQARERKDETFPPPSISHLRSEQARLHTDIFVLHGSALSETR
jgi:hypothetical protein